MQQRPAARLTLTEVKYIFKSIYFICIYINTVSIFCVLYVSHHDHQFEIFLYCVSCFYIFYKVGTVTVTSCLILNANCGNCNLRLSPAVGCCVLAFSIGLLFVQRSGNYFVTMFDDYSATLPLLIVVILENVAIAWFYGIDK